MWLISQYKSLYFFLLRFVLSLFQFLDFQLQKLKEYIKSKYQYMVTH